MSVCIDKNFEEELGRTGSLFALVWFVMPLRPSTTRLLFATLLLLSLGFASPASAQKTAKKVTSVQAPGSSKVTKERALVVRQARRQRVRPEAIVELSAKLTKSILGGAKLGSAKVREAMSVAPLKARLKTFTAIAERDGHTVQTFTRRLRGMLKNGKKNRVVASEKTFFEVVPATKELFRESMGENVIWFASSANPNHLHTLVNDQNGGPTLTHNTYGSMMNEAGVDRLQYMAPVQLDNAQMARFTKYLNAGVEAGYSGRKSVYGFKNSRGDLVYETTCTNWATSAPIGDLQRWAKRADSQVIKASKAGHLGSEFSEGLHAALAKAPDSEARQTLVSQALKAPGLSTFVRGSVKRLGKEFETIIKQFPSRPPELVARQSLSEMMGVSRSQDPAKWMFDLLLSKSVPVVGVMAPTSNPKFKSMNFDMQVMGTFGAKGEVRKGFGVIPPERGGPAVVAE